MRIFSGIQPSGTLHLGNYLGAMKQFVELQNQGDAMYCIVDLHAITVPQEPKKLRQQTLEAAAMYLAVGLDPKKAILFVQSHVKEHAELGWILNTITKVGELERMTQFKDKNQKILRLFEQRIKELDKEDSIKLNQALFDLESELEKYKMVNDVISAGLLNYPVLMAADILLYKTNVVPVGEDQKQHVELTRDLAKRFNKRFGETFVIPDVKLQKAGARIMGLDDPTKKMSKSASSAANYIALTDDTATIEKKIARAVTDSGSTILSGLDRPAITNLLTIMSLLADSSIAQLELRYSGKGYAEFKKDLANIVNESLNPIKKNYEKFLSKPKEIIKILEHGADQAREIAESTMKTVRERVGLL